MNKSGAAFRIDPGGRVFSIVLAVSLSNLKLKLSVSIPTPFLR